MPPRMHRRRFIAATAGAAGYWLTAPALSALAVTQKPNESLRVAGIGVGGKGSSDIDHAGLLARVVALCDVDERFLGAKAEKFPDAKRYFDYRKLFDEMAKDIDAVVVSAPDHHHAPASLRAMKLKKHVYCQKPLTHTVAEARAMRETARAMGVVSQMGNQGTAENGLRRAAEIIQDGLLGDVTEVHVWTNRPVWPQAPSVTARPPESPTPAYLHWEEFIGPAPMRPYAEYPPEEKRKRLGAYHDFNWRGWWDFGTGALGDMACHTANLAFLALRLGHPSSVVAEAIGLNPETFPAGAKVTYKFPARGEMKPLTLIWYEGKRDGQKLLPPDELAQRAVALVKPKDGKPAKLVDSGSILVGSKGLAYSPNDYGAEVLFDPPEQFKGLNTKAPERLGRTSTLEGLDLRALKYDAKDVYMKKEWIDAIKGGPTPLSNFDYAAAFTETVLLGNVAIRLAGSELTWDGPAMRFTNKADANSLLTKAYRRGWEL